MASNVTTRLVRKVRAGVPVDAEDQVAVEEPLELCVSGEPVAVTMRTPGEDAELALGFLFAEGILGSVDEVATIAPCGRPGEEGYGNVIDVQPTPGVSFDLERVQAARRGTLTTAACGVCGRRDVTDLLTLAGPVPGGPLLDPGVLAAAPRALEQVQRAFAVTGGLHAAAALDVSGALLSGFEDVGRHNAVDKVVGALLRARRVGARIMRGARSRAELDPSRAPAILAVSGRASFEIVQKAAMAAIPVVVAVSAPSSLAIDLAQATNITLAAFARGDAFNVYTHPARLRSP